MDQKQKEKMDRRLADIQSKIMDIIDDGYFCEVSFKVCYGQITDWKVSECGHEDLKQN